MTDTPTAVDLSTIVSLCKRRGFLFQSSEIYGGLASTYDYGPLGVELKRNVKDAWWRHFVWGRDDMVGLDASILMHPDVWRASGHVDSFADLLVECKSCKHRYRADQLYSAGAQAEPPGDRLVYFTVEALSSDDASESLRSIAKATLGRDVPELVTFPLTEVGIAERANVPCPNCQSVGEFTRTREFNLMFKTFVGAVEDEASVAYLRPETAQGIFVNFGNVVTATRRKLPFGIAQIGKAFRNEITTGNFIFRTREFEIMELEFFVKGREEADEWHQRWITESMQWYVDLGVDEGRLRVRAHDPDELAHYSSATSDIEYLFPWGWGEIQGIANRADFDLKAHSDKSGEPLTYFDDESGEHITPHVVEPSAGVDRAVMAYLFDAYSEEQAPTASGKTERRVLLKLHPALAPVKVAVLPLSRNERLVSLAREVHDAVRRSGTINGLVQYDDAQSIGRRYRRQDEIGTPLCVTVDFDSLDDQAVTIRERDSMAQVRVPIDGLARELATRLES